MQRNDIQSHSEILKSGSFFWGFLVLLALGAFPLRLDAQSSAAEEGFEKGLWVGWYEPDRPEDAIEVGFDITTRRDLFWGMRLQFGGLVTSDESFYGYGGFRYTLPFAGGRWRIDLSTALGLFENGEGKDLGGVVEFRSGLDLMRQLPNGNYLSLAIYHISNSGIYDLNPGSNTVLLRYVF